MNNWAIVKVLIFLTSRKPLSDSKARNQKEFNNCEISVSHPSWKQRQFYHSSKLSNFSHLKIKKCNSRPKSSLYRRTWLYREVYISTYKHIMCMTYSDGFLFTVFSLQFFSLMVVWKLYLFIESSIFFSFL